jgi:(p)ppGpp synthase/HD superfamily hydrolase
LTARRRAPVLAGLPHTKAAVAYAERMHAGQRRADGGPFFTHPLEVGSLLYYAGAPDHLIAAGILHDLLEKTEVSPSDLMMRFGSRITRLVLAVSEDDRITEHAKRKAALRQQVAGSGDDALALFAADKLSKVRELRREAELDDDSAAARGAARPPRARRLRHYQLSLALLEERLPGLPLVADLRDELRALLGGHRTLASAR